MKGCFVDLYQHFAVRKPEGASGTMRVFRPGMDNVSDSRRHPAVLILPGGGYDHVSEVEGEPVARRFTARGYCAFVLTYSVAPLRYPAALREAAMAMGYIRENAEALSVDPGKVAAVGFSAGGHLCACLGTLYDSAEVADIGPAAMLRPNALGLHYPVAVSWGKTHEGTFSSLCGDDAQLRARLSVDALVRPDMPPVFLWHTRNDASVPCRNSLILARRLEEEQVDFAMHLYRSGCHGLSVGEANAVPAERLRGMSWDVPGWLEAEVRFFEEIGIKVQNCEVEK